MQQAIKTCHLKIEGTL